MRLNAAPGGPATNDAALEGLRKRLAAWGVPDDAEQLVDGSGLSRHDLIAPEALYLLLLKRVHDPAGTSPFVVGAAVAGRGRLAGRADEGHQSRGQPAGEDRHDEQHAQRWPAT